MTTTRPSLREWHGLKPPVICTVKQLARRRRDTISQVYWIVSLRIDNSIMEAQPLKSWHFAADGRLIGEVDAGAWQRIVEINPDEYVVLSLK